MPDSDLCHLYRRSGGPNLKQLQKGVPMQQPVDNSKQGDIVLVIDDDSAVAGDVKELLESEGFEVLVALNPVEGVRLYEQRWPTIKLVLVDFLMPILRGDEALERLQRVRPDVQALLMSSCDGDVVKQVVERGFRGFVQKPFTPEELLGQ